MFKKTILFSLLILSFSGFFGCGGPSIKKMLEPGVSQDLAQYRKKFISDIHYHLFFNIPAEKDQAVNGRVMIEFHQSRAQRGVVIDFRGGEENIQQVVVNGKPEEYQYLNQHIILSSKNIIPGQNQVEVHFTSTDQALNRSEDFMYTLFVPDRASTAFPCFDQPDLKAFFSLELEIPEPWNALSNGPLLNTSVSNGRKTLTFDSDQPISTYLFAFTAGRFDTISETRGERTITVFHRETDLPKLNRNLEAIFSQHFDALAWLEDYTSIPYPFKKLDMAILPGFQYSGMEHPGAIWYRDTRLLLDEQAPISNQLSKAALIAHETSHMWFGNLVTMQWFDDVWLKEVFAGFMADKIVKPQYPEVDHDMQFLLSHYPRAYAIDRSQGTHPIKQKLENLNQAGTLYGAIIYNKAPIVFQQLEWLTGVEAFQTAIKEYLQTFAFGNADWDDLALILDKHTALDLIAWSQAWVYGKGMAEIHYQYQFINDTITGITLSTSPPAEGEPFPSQKLKPVILDENYQPITEEWFFDQTPQNFILEAPIYQPVCMLLNGGGAGYGYMVPNRLARRTLLEQLPLRNDDYLKAAAFLNMHEDFLSGNLSAETYLQALATGVSRAQNPQLASYLINNLQMVYWRFLNKETRDILCQPLETMLWEKMVKAPNDQKALYFDAFVAISHSMEAQLKIQKMLKQELSVWGLRLSEDQRFDMVASLMLHEHPRAEWYSERLVAGTTNPDRLRRIEFVLPALSSDPVTRDAFFERLALPENRRPEPWVLEGLRYLHHPLRSGSSLKYLPKSLKMLEEIQQTGDIFFPLNWLEATLSGYNQPRAAQMVRDFLDQPEFTNENLRLKTLQAADLLFRAADREE
ncbi:MAG: M1 family aminopeptidase [Bacteroides sp.]|jgi:aminopeptidase N|nr:M1 family aminopeptidase [Bacteroides sp.]